MTILYEYFEQIREIFRKIKTNIAETSSEENMIHAKVVEIYIKVKTIKKKKSKEAQNIEYSYDYEIHNSILNFKNISEDYIIVNLKNFFSYSIFHPIENIIIFSIIIVLVPVLLTVALLTLMERKMMAALQRRRGPNIVGFFGILQPFADGLKLLTKEFNIPGRSFDTLVTTTPMMSLLFTCSCFSLVPLSNSFLYYTTNSISALYIMAISSLNIYSIIMAGWSSKSAYAFLGSLRASAQFISYEVSLTLNIMGVFLISGSFNLVEIAYMQEETLPNVFIIFPVFLLYLIGVLSETNRTPYDLAEAESELVAGYGVEFSAVGFAFFFIAEYASIILYCLLILNLFFSGFSNLFFDFFFLILKAIVIFINKDAFLDERYIEYIVFATNGERYMNESLKNIPELTHQMKFIFEIFLFSFGVFIFLSLFVHIRATYARYRFDQLMKLNWKNLLVLSLIFDLFIASILLLNIPPIFVINQGFITFDLGDFILIYDLDVLLLLMTVVLIFYILILIGRKIAKG